MDNELTPTSANFSIVKSNKKTLYFIYIGIVLLLVILLFISNDQCVAGIDLFGLLCFVTAKDVGVGVSIATIIALILFSLTDIFLLRNRSNIIRIIILLLMIIIGASVSFFSTRYWQPYSNKNILTVTEVQQENTKRQKEDVEHKTILEQNRGRYSITNFKDTPILDKTTKKIKALEISFNIQSSQKDDFDIITYLESDTFPMLMVNSGIVDDFQYQNVKLQPGIPTKVKSLINIIERDVPAEEMRGFFYAKINILHPGGEVGHSDEANFWGAGYEHWEYNYGPVYINSALKTRTFKTSDFIGFRNGLKL